MMFKHNVSSDNSHYVQFLHGRTMYQHVIVESFGHAEHSTRRGLRFIARWWQVHLVYVRCLLDNLLIYPLVLCYDMTNVYKLKNIILQNVLKLLL